MRSPKRRQGRRLWLEAHRYLALGVGLLFVLLGLSGSLNVFFLELDPWLNPTLIVADTAAPARPLADIQRLIRDRHPDWPGAWRLDLPSHPQDALKAWYYPTPDEHRGHLAAPLLSIDPYAAAVLAEREFYHGTAVGWVYKLHLTLLLGKPGETLVGLLGPALAVSALSGVYLWWPGSWRRLKAAATIKFTAGAGRLIFDLHRSLGVYSALILIVLGLSGGYFVFESTVTPLLARLCTIRQHPWQDPPGLAATPRPGAQIISADQAIASARRVFPGAELKSLSLPGGPAGYYVAAFRQAGEANITFPASKVWVDPYTGAILASLDPNQFSAGETLINLAFPIHSGEVFGLPGRLIIFATGLMPLALYITGSAQWWRKRAAPKRRAVPSQPMPKPRH
jgi:uncharacterized iron-regulated membrane protein